MGPRAVARRLMFGALVIGFVPITTVSDAAAAESPASMCSTAFGEEGPDTGPVVGEGPPGDPMPVTIAWNPSDWPDGLRDVVTCVSVDGGAVPSLASAQGAPPNSGTFNFDLRLPAGEPGTVVCQQGLLVGAGERRRPTSPYCFRLRATDSPPPALSGGHTTDEDPAPAAAPATPPARLLQAEPTRAAAAGDGSARTSGPAIGRAGAAAPDAEPPRPTLARTGIGDRIPLASAGTFLALGGAAIVLGEPRRRARPARAR